MAGSERTQTAVQSFSPDAVIDDGSSLFSPGGPFEGYPGAIVLAGHNGIVLSANSQAEPIGAMLRSECYPELRDAVRSALAGATAQIHPLLVPESNNGKQIIRAYDLVVLPWVEGAAALLLGRDITLERSLRSSLVEAHDRYKALVHLSSEFAWECDSDGCFSYLSKDRVLGYLAIDLLGRPAKELLVPQDKPLDPFNLSEAAGPLHCQFKSAGGQVVSGEIFAEPFFAKDKSLLGVRGTCGELAAGNDE